MNVIIAIDPSIVHMGVAVFRDDILEIHGTFDTKENDTDRYREIQLAFSSLIDECQPTILGIETQYLMANRGGAVLKTCKVAGICIGVFLEKVPHGRIIEVTPAEAKSVLSLPGGIKRKEAKQAAIMRVQQLYPHIGKINDNEADAIAIGLATRSKV